MSGFRPTAFMIRSTLLPLTKRTWATPCESRRMMPIWEGVMPFLPSFLICSFTSSAFNFSHDGTERR
uniref:Putative secreted protein n=1 Tax=Anopheles darlingi TaxID=43151 RepID=A0A2M4DMA5_ANODA